MQGCNYWCKFENNDCGFRLNILYVPISSTKILFFDGYFTTYTLVVDDDMLIDIIMDLQNASSGKHYQCKCGDGDYCVCCVNISIGNHCDNGNKIIFVASEFEDQSFVMDDDMRKDIIKQLQDLLSKPSVNYFGNSDNTTFS